MPIAGSEPTLPNTTQDGQAPQGESQSESSAPVLSLAPPEKAVENAPDITVKNLRAMGITEEIARQVIRSTLKSEGVLNRRVASGISSVTWVNSLSNTSKLQTIMLKMARDKNLDAKVRVAAASCGAQLGMTLAKIGECIIDVSKSDRTSAPVAEPQEGGTNITFVQKFDYPPVAAAPMRAINGPERPAE